MSAGIVKDTFELTAFTGGQFRSAARAARDAGLTALVDGHGMMYTSAGHNLALQLSGARLAALMASEVGSSVTVRPSVSGTTLSMPAGRVYLDGEVTELWGAGPQGAQSFDLSGVAPGRYALVIETWTALVGVTTFGKATIPSFAAGVVSRSNKPADSAFYRAGNLDAAASVPDTALVTGTLETQRGLQRQYRLTLRKDATLVGVPAAAAHPLDRASTLYAGTGDVVSAFSPLSATSSSVAVDGAYTACKLALVDVALTGSAVLVNAPHLHLSATGVGQSPIALRPSRQDYMEFVTCEIDRLDVQDALTAERVLQLEKLADRGVYTAGTQELLAQVEQRLFFETERADALGWHDGSTIAQRFALDFSGSLQVICHATFAPGGVAGALDGQRGLALYRNGESTGILVRGAALGGVTHAAQLSAEIDVSPGDVLEVAAFHSSAVPNLAVQGARLTLRRTA